MSGRLVQENTFFFTLHGSTLRGYSVNVRHLFCTSLQEARRSVEEKGLSVRLYVSITGSDGACLSTPSKHCAGQGPDSFWAASKGRITAEHLKKVVFNPHQLLAHAFCRHHCVPPAGVPSYWVVQSSEVRSLACLADSNNVFNLPTSQRLGVALISSS
jgi:hypothetical protein